MEYVVLFIIGILLAAGIALFVATPFWIIWIIVEVALFLGFILFGNPGDW